MTQRRGLAPARSAAALAAAALCAGGCALDGLSGACEVGPCACPDGRRDASGWCCPAWSSVDARGRCAARAWSLPDAQGGVGEPGARALDLAIGADARAIAAWEIAGGAGESVALAEELASGWATRAPAGDLPGPARAPAVAAWDGGAAIVAWAQGGAAPFVAAAERDAAGAFHDAAARSLPPSGGAPAVAAAGGEVILVWSQATPSGHGVALARKPSAGAAWALPAGPGDLLAEGASAASAPRIALGDGGEALVVWLGGAPDRPEVHARERRSPGGVFAPAGGVEALGPASSAGAALRAGGPAGHPVPALGPGGEAAVAWLEDDGAGGAALHLALRDPGGAWALPRDRAGAFARSASLACAPRLAFGRVGELFVAWCQDRAAGPRVVAAHRAPDGVWTEPGARPAVLSLPDAAARSPALAANGDGEVVAAWSEQGRDGALRLVARRAPGVGTTWGDLEALSPEGAGDATAPAAAVGGPRDRFVVGWIQGPPGEGRVFFAHAD